MIRCNLLGALSISYLVYLRRGSGWSSTRTQDWSGVLRKWGRVDDVHVVVGGNEIRRHLEGAVALLTLLGKWVVCSRATISMLKAKS